MRCRTGKPKPLLPVEGPPTALDRAGPDPIETRTHRWHHPSDSGGYGAAYRLLNATTNVPALLADWKPCNTWFTTISNQEMTGYRRGLSGLDERAGMYQVAAPHRAILEVTDE